MWNHRILAHEFPNGNIEFHIHEVYYDNHGIADGCTKNPITIGGDDINSIYWQLEKIKDCLEKPILYFGDKFPQEYKKRII